MCDGEERNAIWMLDGFNVRFVSLSEVCVCVRVGEIAWCFSSNF